MERSQEVFDLCEGVVRREEEEGPFSTSLTELFCVGRVLSPLYAC